MEPKENIENSGLVRLVKDSPQWKSLSMMPKMALKAFSCCLAGYLPVEHEINAYGEIWTVYRAIQDQIFRHGESFYLCAVGGVKTDDDYIFPMQAYKNYCDESKNEYPLDQFVFSEEYVRKQIENMELVCEAEQRNEYYKQMTEEEQSKPTEYKSDIKQISLDTFENLEICDGVKLSDLRTLLDPNSKSYLPRLPILLRLAVHVHKIKAGTTRYNQAMNEFDLKGVLKTAGIGQPLKSKHSAIEAVNPDIDAIERILKRKKVLPGGREPEPIDDPNPYL